MARSLKKGPFVALSLEKKVQKNVEENKKAVYFLLVPCLSFDYKYYKNFSCITFRHRGNEYTLC